MKEVMCAAPLGDDVLGDDPSVQALEKRLAALFEKEAALFFPSSTMANLIGLQVLAAPGDEIIADRNSHIFFLKLEGLPLLVG